MHHGLDICYGTTRFLWKWTMPILCFLTFTVLYHCQKLFKAHLPWLGIFKDMHTPYFKDMHTHTHTLTHIYGGQYVSVVYINTMMHEHGIQSAPQNNHLIPLLYTKITIICRKGVISAIHSSMIPKTCCQFTRCWNAAVMKIKCGLSCLDSYCIAKKVELRAFIKTEGKLKAAGLLTSRIPKPKMNLKL